jgi:hypothetical protein
MKKLLLLGFLASSLTAFADDGLLQNGDFSNGLAEWEGDLHSAGSASDTSGATSGVVVKMRTDWTKISQDFDGKAGNYLLTITYTVTPDFSLSDKKDDYVNVPGQLELTRLTSFDSPPGQWVIIINDLAVMQYTYWLVTPSTGTGVQTVQRTVQLQSSEAGGEKGFFLGFPPGNGSINILGISLKPQGAATAAN